MAFGIKLHCWGDLACFTRPEMKVERVSYDVITPSAARAIVEAVYWKPEIRWTVDRIRVLRPIRFTSLRRNEVGAKISGRDAAAAMRAGTGQLGLYIDEVDNEGKLKNRQQRAALLLRDVAYVIEAHFDVVSGDPDPAKHIATFNRRAKTGQCFTRPYFGTRECAADFALVEAGAEPVDQLPANQRTRDLGWMLHDIDYKNDNQPRFFHAKMNDGVIVVPPFDGEGVRA